MAKHVKGNTTYTVTTMIINGKSTASFDEAQALVNGMTPVMVNCEEGPFGTGSLMPHAEANHKLAATLDFGNAIVNCTILRRDRGKRMTLTTEAL